MSLIQSHEVPARGGSFPKEHREIHPVGSSQKPESHSERWAEGWALSSRRLENISLLARIAYLKVTTGTCPFVSRKPWLICLTDIWRQVHMTGTEVPSGGRNQTWGQSQKDGMPMTRGCLLPYSTGKVCFWSTFPLKLLPWFLFEKPISILSPCSTNGLDPTASGPGDECVTLNERTNQSHRSLAPPTTAVKGIVRWPTLGKWDSDELPSPFHWC